MEAPRKLCSPYPYLFFQNLTKETIQIPIQLQCHYHSLSLLLAAVSIPPERTGIASRSIISLCMNELIASNDAVVRDLIATFAYSKRRVALAACNAVMDLSTALFGRRRLVEVSPIECLM
ncbi:hypothetical protein SDJN02_15409, partial [Cucurbita argyrosperma subsp. argyrosperma]